MTYAQAANTETCAAPGCHQPVDVDVTLTAGDTQVVIGYCAPCSFTPGHDIAAAPEPAPAAARRPTRWQWGWGR